MLNKFLRYRSSFIFRQYSTKLKPATKPEIPLGFISHLTDRRVISLTGKDTPKMLQTISCSISSKFFTDEKLRSAYCLVLEDQKPNILYDFFIHKPFLEESEELGSEFWMDVHESTVNPLIHYIMKHCEKYNIADTHATDISRDMKVYSALSPYGMRIGSEGHVYEELQNTAPKFPADNDPNVFSYNYKIENSV